MMNCVMHSSFVRCHSLWKLSSVNLLRMKKLTWVSLVVTSQRFASSLYLHNIQCRSDRVLRTSSSFFIQEKRSSFPSKPSRWRHSTEPDTSVFHISNHPYTTDVKAEESQKLLPMCPQEFVEFLKSNKITRCFLIWSDSENRVVASHPVLKEIEDWLNDPSNPYYKQHEAIFLSIGIRTGHLLGAFLWKINRGQACGGLRMSPLPTLEVFLSEGLRLSRKIGIKSSLAGLWVGGGKGLVPEPKDKLHIKPDFRQKLCFDYGDFLSSLNGCFIAGMDTGINTYDLYNIHSRTRWAICGPEDIGGSGSACTLVGRGLLCAMEAALNFLRMGDLSGKSVAIQGAGGIGLEVASGLLDRNVSHVYVTDTSQKRVGDVRDTLGSKARGRLKVDKVPIGDTNILGYNCDILAPCAVGHVLRSDTIPSITAKIVCGAANTLLPNEDDCHLLEERNITFVPEYLPNRMALVNSVHENYGRLYKDPIIERHFNKEWDHSIYVLTQKVLRMSCDKQISVLQAANLIAEEFSEEHHPIWPGRTKAIIQDLICRQWHHGNDFWRKRRNFAKSESCA